MTKIAEIRSARRRTYLVKAAGGYAPVRTDTTRVARDVPPLLPPRYQGRGGFRVLLDDTVAEGMTRLSARMDQLRRLLTRTTKTGPAAVQLPEPTPPSPGKTAKGARTNSLKPILVGTPHLLGGH